MLLFLGILKTTMMKYIQFKILFIFLLFQFLAQGKEMQEGYWQGELQLQETHHLEFIFEVKDDHITIHNDEERVKMKSMEFEKDSIKVYFSSFPNYLIFKMDSKAKNKLAGYFVNPDRKKHARIIFKAEYLGTEIKDEKSIEDSESISGKWQVQFSPNTSDEYPAIGKFKQKQEKITGTFLTETGDYRFLKGAIHNKKVKLTSFDGAHVFLFTAHLENDTLKGEFLSGNHWKTNWIGFRNETFQLEDPDSLTYMVKDTFEFNFKTVNDKAYIFPNESLKGKVVIVQILGTWCPNCLDETQFYKDLYDQFHSYGLEIIGVAYETPETFKEQVNRINRYRKNKDIPYPILVGGKSSKLASSEDFDMLNEVISFPTSIFINKDGEVVKIHTGFNGPGTDEIYKAYIKETTEFINRLLRE